MPCNKPPQNKIAHDSVGGLDRAPGLRPLDRNGEARTASLPWLAAGSGSAELILSPFIGEPGLLHVAASGFQRQPENQTQRVGTFQARGGVTFAVVLLARERHMARTQSLEALLKSIEKGEGYV